MRTLISLTLVAVLASNAAAQQLSANAKVADSARTLIEHAVYTDSAVGLDVAGALLDRALAAAPADYLLLHYRGYALYRQATNSDDNNNKDLAKRQFQDAETFLAASAAAHPLAETSALRVTVAGRLASMGSDNPVAYKMMAGRMQAEADALGPSNPRVALLHGIRVLNGPPDRTGGPPEAERLLQVAHDLFATDSPSPPLPSWGRAEACAYLAVARHALGNDAGARAAAHEALVYAPSYRYVKYTLLPMLGEKPPVE